MKVINIFNLGGRCHKKCRRHKKRPIRMHFSRVEYNGTVIEGVIKKMELREGKKVLVGVTPKTAGGNSAAYETGSANWESSNSAVVTVEENPENELQAWVTSVDGSKNESVVVTCSLDGDPDADETRDIIATGDFTATQGEATVVSMEVLGEPVDA